MEKRARVIGPCWSQSGFPWTGQLADRRCLFVCSRAAATSLFEGRRSGEGETMEALTARPSARCLPPCSPWLPGELAGLAALVGLLSSCTSPTSTPNPTRSPEPSASASAAVTPTNSLAVTSYCDALDTSIPGAASALAAGQPLSQTLTPVQQAWYQMWASMVPACSEITPDPLSVQTKNLTNDEISDTSLAGWVQLDSNHWALWEWAGQHDQWGLMRFLLSGNGNAATEFVESGGKIVDSTPACEYPVKVYAVSLGAADMSSLTGGRMTAPGIGYALAWAGPCTTTWTSASGQVKNYDTAAGQEYLELEITQTAMSPALGEYLETVGSADPGTNSTAQRILEDSGI